MAVCVTVVGSGVRTVKQTPIIVIVPNIPEILVARITCEPVSTVKILGQCVPLSSISTEQALLRARVPASAIQIFLRPGSDPFEITDGTLISAIGVHIHQPAHGLFVDVVRKLRFAGVVEVAVGVHGLGPLVNQVRGLFQDRSVVGRLVHTRHAADELAEGIENIRVPNSSVTVISLTPAVPADERRPRGRKTGALSKAEQQVVIGNI